MDDNNIYFTPDLTSEEIEEAFEDEAWIENVTEAALFGATSCFQKGKDNYEIMHDIIVYNVSRRMCELFIKNGKPIPKLIQWETSLSVLDAYQSFESIAAKFAIEKKMEIFKKTDVNIQIDNQLIQNELQDWCERLKNEYPLDIHYEKIKGNVYKISFE